MPLLRTLFKPIKWYASEIKGLTNSTEDLLAHSFANPTVSEAQDLLEHTRQRQAIDSKAFDAFGGVLRHGVKVLSPVVATDIALRYSTKTPRDDFGDILTDEVLSKMGNISDHVAKILEHKNSLLNTLRSKFKKIAVTSIGQNPQNPMPPKDFITPELDRGNRRIVEGLKVNKDNMRQVQPKQPQVPSVEQIEDKIAFLIEKVGRRGDMQRRRDAAALRSQQNEKALENVMPTSGAGSYLAAEQGKASAPVGAPVNAKSTLSQSMMPAGPEKFVENPDLGEKSLRARNAEQLGKTGPVKPSIVSGGQVPAPSSVAPAARRGIGHARSPEQIASLTQKMQNAAKGRVLTGSTWDGVTNLGRSLGQLRRGVFGGSPHSSPAAQASMARKLPGAATRVGKAGLLAGAGYMGLSALNAWGNSQPQNPYQQGYGKYGADNNMNLEQVFVQGFMDKIAASIKQVGSVGAGLLGLQKGLKSAPNWKKSFIPTLGSAPAAASVKGGAGALATGGAPVIPGPVPGKLISGAPQSGPPGKKFRKSYIEGQASFDIRKAVDELAKMACFSLSKIAAAGRQIGLKAVEGLAGTAKAPGLITAPGPSRSIGTMLKNKSLAPLNTAQKAHTQGVMKGRGGWITSGAGPMARAEGQLAIR